jgi:Tol biopolymer transport system component
LIGQTLSHFRVTAKLGEGGMGEVYRAEDTKLGREVAIKVLPPALTEDSDRLARFEREAKVLASLNHPNIAGIHQIEEVDQKHLLVLELVEGEDLAERLARGPVSLEATLPFALQLAEGLEAAHAKGIVHRDLKPANIKITPEGQVKILDFGLAKATGPSSETSPLTHSPTLTAQMTQAGVLLGTAAYMSPEQARGEEADPRADVWAFGSVLFEMLTGAKAFPGDNLTDLLAEIVKGQVDWSALPEDTPRNFERLLRRCLVKDRNQRLQAVGDARIEIQEILSGEGDGELAQAPGPAASGGRKTGAIVTLALTSAALAALVTWRLAAPSAPQARPPLVQTLVATPNLARINFPALSPSGNSIAFVGDGRLWVHDLSEQVSRELPETAGGTRPFWSPDSEWIGYFDRLRILKIRADGGAPVPLAALPAECSDLACGGSWGDDGAILLGLGNTGILSVPELGGTPTTFVEPGPGEHFHEPAALPDGRGVIFLVDPDADSDRYDVVLDGTRLRGPTGGGFPSTPAYSSEGYFIFPGSTGVWTSPFDLQPGTPPGEPFLLVPRAGFPSVSRHSETLLVVRPRQVVHQLVWADRQGIVREAIDEPRDRAIAPTLSPDGSRIAALSTEGGRNAILVLDPARGARSWVPHSESALDVGWAANGNQLLWVGPGPTGFDDIEQVINLQGVGQADSTVLAPGYGPRASRDGAFLVYTVNDFIERDIVFKSPDDPEAEHQVFLADTGFQGGHELSPDGRFIAFLHSDTGMMGLEVFVSPFPQGGERIQVSNGGVDWQTQIRWRGDGRKLYYLRGSDGTLMEVDVDLSQGIRLSPPDELFRDADAGLDLSGGFDVRADGERFLVTRATVPAGGDRGGLLLIQNWMNLLPESP